MENTATLSRRESEVAELIAWGASKKDVADKLYISERTVENHCRSIYQKTNVTKSNELAAWWFCKKYGISAIESPITGKIAIALVVITTLFVVLYAHPDMAASIGTLLNKK